MTFLLCCGVLLKQIKHINIIQLNEKHDKEIDEVLGSLEQNKPDCQWIIPILKGMLKFDKNMRFSLAKILEQLNISLPETQFPTEKRKAKKFFEPFEPDEGFEILERRPPLPPRTIAEPIDDDDDALVSANLKFEKFWLLGGNISIPVKPKRFDKKIDLRSDRDEFNNEKTMKYKISGEIYHGSYQEGFRSKFGLQVWSDGKCYKGEFRRDFASGVGTMIFPNGSVFTGDWDNGLLDKGTLFQKDKTIYIGRFESDLKHGLGIELCQNGVIYEGRFIKGKKNGKGILLDLDDKFYEVEYAEDKLIKKNEEMKDFQTYDLIQKDKQKRNLEFDLNFDDCEAKKGGEGEKKKEKVSISKDCDDKEKFGSSFGKIPNLLADIKKKNKKGFESSYENKIKISSKNLFADINKKIDDFGDMFLCPNNKSNQNKLAQKEMKSANGGLLKLMGSLENPQEKGDKFGTFDDDLDILDDLLPSEKKKSALPLLIKTHENSEKDMKFEPKSLIKKEDLCLIDNFMKENRLITENLQLEVLNNNDILESIMFEFLAQEKAFFFSMQEGENLIELHDVVVKSGKLCALKKCDKELNSVREHLLKFHLEKKEKMEFDLNCRMFIPFENDSVAFYMIELFIAAKKVFFYYKKNPDTETLDKAKNMMLILQEIFKFPEETPCVDIILEEPSVKELEKMKPLKYLPYIASLFQVLYETAESTHPEKPVLDFNKKTLERMFVIASLTGQVFQIFEGESLKLMVKHFEELQQVLSTGSQCLILHHEETLSEKVEIDKFAEACYEILSGCIKKLSEVDQIFLSLVVVIPEGGHCAYYFHFTTVESEDQEKPILRLFYLVDYDYLLTVKILQIVNFLVNDNLQFECFFDFSRHPGLYEFSKISLVIWAEYAMKHNRCVEGFRYLSYSMIPFYTATIGEKENLLGNEKGNE